MFWGDGTPVLVHRVRANHAALLRDRNVHFSDDLTIVVARISIEFSSQWHLRDIW
jgi:hypothetical protein